MKNTSKLESATLASLQFALGSAQYALGIEVGLVTMKSLGTQTQVTQAIEQGRSMVALDKTRLTSVVSDITAEIARR